MPEINSENYRHFPAVSNSDLHWLYQYWMPPAWVMDCTSAFANGTLIDCMITEKHRVDYFRRRVEGESYQYSVDEFEAAKEMKRAFDKDPFCQSFIKNCLFQHISYREKFQINFDGFEFELPAKCKWDLFRPDIDLGGDIKSTTATTQKQVEEAVRHFAYDQARAWYMDISGRNNDMLIFISKKNFKIFKVPIRRGDKIYTDGLKKYQEIAFRWWMLFGEMAPLVEPKMIDPIQTPGTHLPSNNESSRNKHIKNFNKIPYFDYDLDANGMCYSDADPGL